MGFYGHFSVKMGLIEFFTCTEKRQRKPKKSKIKNQLGQSVDIIILQVWGDVWSQNLIFRIELFNFYLNFHRFPRGLIRHSNGQRIDSKQ